MSSPTYARRRAIARIMDTYPDSELVWCVLALAALDPPRFDRARRRLALVHNARQREAAYYERWRATATTPVGIPDVRLYDERRLVRAATVYRRCRALLDAVETEIEKGIGTWQASQQHEKKPSRA